MRALTCVCILSESNLLMSIVRPEGREEEARSCHNGETTSQASYHEIICQKSCTKEEDSLLLCQEKGDGEVHSDGSSVCKHSTATCALNGGLVAVDVDLAITYRDLQRTIEFVMMM